MKYFVNRIVVALLVVTLASVAAFAKGNKGTISFDSNTRVNGTLVKKGTYEVKFDEQAGELSIIKGKKVIAKTAAKLQDRANKARGAQHVVNVAADEAELISVTFGGSRQDIVVTAVNMQMGVNQ